MSTLKIAYVSTPRAHYIHPYLEYFARRGHDVHLLSYDHCDYPMPDGVTVHDISLGANARRNRTKWRYPLTAVKARQVLQRIAPDIVHGHYAKSAGMICFLSGYRPYVVSVRGSDLIKFRQSWFWPQLLKRVLRASTTVHAVSKQLAGITHALGVTTDRIMVLTQGVDTKKFVFRSPRVHNQSRHARIICTRTLAATYDPSTIIEACRCLAMANVRFNLTFAATGPQQADIQKSVERYGLDEHVCFLGGYENAVLPKLLAQYDIYVSASKWDGTSVSLLEAMAVGLVPVLSGIEANTEWVADGKTAHLFDAGDVGQLVEALKKAISQTASWGSVADENRRVIETHANRETNMESMESVYESIKLRFNK